MWLEAHYHEAEKLRGRPLGRTWIILHLQRANKSSQIQVQSTNIASERNSPCHAQSGMASRRRTASKNAPVASSANGICKIRTPIQPRSASLPPRPVWRRPKLEIGSRIVDNVIVPPLRRTGKSHSLRVTLFFAMPPISMSQTAMPRKIIN